MNKQMMNMDDLDQVNGGNILDDAWNWVRDKVTDTYNNIKPHTLPDDVTIAGR